ncbi:MAG: hypothetical protein M1817_001003 [Caeruleum heppii]|nr:MAG: hypothetical protein M1817_001003 [Caeruleum heppii]
MNPSPDSIGRRDHFVPAGVSSRDGAAESKPQEPPPPVAAVSVTSPKVTHQVDQGRESSLEQSVRVFKLFEALRRGETATVLKAMRDGSARDDGGTRKSTSSSASTKNALDGTTVLHLAVQCADVPVIESILSTAAASPDISFDINARDRDGNTPLHLAALLGRESVVALLLDDNSVNDTIPNYQGRLPLDLAKSPAIHQQLQLARSIFLDAKIRHLQTLVVAREYQKLETLLVEPRVQPSLDINGTELVTDPTTAEAGGTLLHEAARKKESQLIELLLLNGADPFRRDRKGKLPQDVTKDDRVRNTLKKSPAAAAAQRGIQEKAVLGGSAPGPSGGFSATAAGDSALANKDGREMKGYLKKWTNYTGGYKLRWFVLEDGVLSYYKHQDDAGSACRGAINMRIAKLYMDSQDKDKLKFDIHGKSSVKYHLKANHAVEAKRWYWALNNAIQWTKDEAKEEERKKQRDQEALHQAKSSQTEKVLAHHRRSMSGSRSLATGKRGHSPSARTNGPTSAAALTSRVTLAGSSTGPGSVLDDEDGVDVGSYAPSVAGEGGGASSHLGFAVMEGDFPDEEDGSFVDARQTKKDAFDLTVQSAKMQLDMLEQVSTALQAESSRNPGTTISDDTIVQTLAAYQSSVDSLRGLIRDLLKISRDRDSFWRGRLDREAGMRRLWEDSMTRVAREQEALEDKLGESEDKRRLTKWALREALESSQILDADDPPGESGVGEMKDSNVGTLAGDATDRAAGETRRRKSSVPLPRQRRPTVTRLEDLSDTDSDEEDEFFDAIDAGEVEVVKEMPLSPDSVSASREAASDGSRGREAKKNSIMPSFQGYEDPVRTRLKLDADDRPKISLWGILKSMVGKDMTKMTLPVSFNEPTSLLQRVAEDMEYTELLDVAADRTDSAERMVYVATFAASGYASTIGRVAKPFNPLLGETYEYARPDRGCRFFMEQVSHHPPIGAACAESPNWDYYGESAVKSKFYGKSFEFNPLGTWFLKLRPPSGGEELYTWKKITSSVVGIITNNPTVDNYGPMEVKNWTTGEVCHLDFKQRGWRAAGAYQMSGQVVNPGGYTTWNIDGHWNDKIYARPTGELGRSSTSASLTTQQAFLVWQASSRPTGIPFNLTPFVVTLNALPDALRPHLAPTDTRLRPDQRAMEDGEYDFAAVEKNRVEEKQRARRKERETKGEEHVPRWFERGRCEVTGEEYWVFKGEYWKAREKGQWEGVEDIF